MAHGIEKPIDIVLSTKGSEWHGLADTVDAIDGDTIKPLCFPILEGAVVIPIDGKNVPMSNHKALVADLRGRADLAGTENELVPLHIPKNGYRPITNGEVWQALTDALKDTGVKVSSAGTIHAGKKFFISADLKDASEQIINGEKFLSYLNFVTSHDGTMALTVVDSHTRQVCQNTIMASLASAGDLEFKIYHTAGAQLAVKNMGSLLSEVINQRATFKNNVEYFASVSITALEVERFFAGYLAHTSQAEKLATRSKNAVEELTALFSRGIGNNGKTLADVWNSATEYWTHGNGTGKKSDKLEKAYKARFGGAADHKAMITNYLLSPARVEQFIREGERILLDSMKIG